MPIGMIYCTAIQRCGVIHVLDFFLKAYALALIQERAPKKLLVSKNFV
jgi:hypothetical protein